MKMLVKIRHSDYSLTKRLPLEICVVSSSKQYRHFCFIFTDGLATFFTAKRDIFSHNVLGICSTKTFISITSCTIGRTETQPWNLKKKGQFLAIKNFCTTIKYKTYPFNVYRYERKSTKKNTNTVTVKVYVDFT